MPLSFSAYLYQRQSGRCYLRTSGKCQAVDGSLDLHALAAALAPVLLAEPSQRARDIAESGTATMLDAAYVARDLLPLLKAISPEERATVLDYLDAVIRATSA